MLDPTTIFVIAFVGVLAVGLAALMVVFWSEWRRR